ncbi:putative sporulation protein YtxC [Metaclostridioides mangenotii]|uniref:Sporulation protein YtxC n=1 Tax=Metaclostridioides mangenotii TaxID=1540 RepID=A0ABS4EDD8_9FIRM|nr:putative sporulation protein YtxC [Clostridioides mangenotii]MBP1855960.1 putative sporulation protein YtxC [Clostridioides mangenotii]
MADKKGAMKLISKDKISDKKFYSNNINNKLIYTNGIVEVVTSSGKNEVISRKVIDDKVFSSEGLNLDEITERITNKIIKIMRGEVLKDYIQSQYGKAYPKEIDNIYEHSLKIFSNKEVFIRETIFMRVSNYILENDYINIDGFIKFRMKEFIKYISAIADISLEEYLINRDHEEFIRVLKYFIDTQDVKIDLLKVHIMEDNSFVLYDKNGDKIDSIDDEDIINMVIRENLNYEDFLISTLLSLCPRKIEVMDTLNSNSSKEIIDTLKSIFENRIDIISNN